MKSNLRSVVIGTSVVSLACLGQWSSADCSNQTTCQESTGPDVIVGDITGPFNYTANATLDALSLGTYSCNQGTVPLNWIAPNNQHPVIGGNLYKMKTANGYTTYEQIGMSWLKHGFLALCNSICGCACQCDADGDHLGVGCSDPYTAQRNGTQGSLGPRWQVNANTGFFTYPPANPAFSSNGRRLEVLLSDLEPSSGTVKYFGETQYVSPDDAANNNQNNNASYRAMTVTGGPANYTFSLIGLTMDECQGIRAWKDQDPTVTELEFEVPSEGLYILSYQVTDLGNGTWHYEYALYNMNSNRNGGSFSVPVPDCVEVTNIGFHDVVYRNGDGPANVNMDGTDWAATLSGGSLTWATTPFSPPPALDGQNALRWGTTYNFRFDANTPPTNADITVGLHKTGTPSDFTFAAQGPSAPTPPACPADLANADNQINVDDMLVVINAWGPCPEGTCTTCTADLANADNQVNVDDLLVVINAWGKCP